MNEFRDIRIVDLDISLTEESETASDLRHMFLRLSDTPPSEWVEIFDAERGFPRHSMWRKAWVDGAHIVVDCVPEEIERHHLEDLKQDVASSNAKYRDLLSRSQQHSERQRQSEHAEKQRLGALRGRLNFE